jgi:hypothetical protein
MGPTRQPPERKRGKGASQLGLGPERGAGFGPKWPKRRKGERERLFPFYFPNKIFKLFSK